MEKETVFNGKWKPTELPLEAKRMNTRWIFRNKQDGVKKPSFQTEVVQEHSHPQFLP